MNNQKLLGYMQIPFRILGCDLFAKMELDMLGNPPMWRKAAAEGEGNGNWESRSREVRQNEDFGYCLGSRAQAWPSLARGATECEVQFLLFVARASPRPRSREAG